MPSLRDISIDTFAISWSQRSLNEGLIAMLAIGVALRGSALSGHEAAGAIARTAAKFRTAEKF